MKKKLALKVGDSVRVKQGVRDADFDLDLSGWQGRVQEIYPDGILAVKWDSITLKSMPESFIVATAQKGYAWEQYNLSSADVEKTKPRDTEDDVEDAYEEIEARLGWIDLGPEGEELNQILIGLDRDDEWAILERWEEYFRQTLTFPFDAEVSEWQDRGPLQSGDVVRVHGITNVDEFYGLIARVRKGRRQYYFPLCDLTPVDEESPNYTPVHLYAVWFANR